MMEQWKKEVFTELLTSRKSRTVLENWGFTIPPRPKTSTSSAFRKGLIRPYLSSYALEEDSCRTPREHQRMIRFYTKWYENTPEETSYEPKASQAKITNPAQILLLHLIRETTHNIPEPPDLTIHCLKELLE